MWNSIFLVPVFFNFPGRWEQMICMWQHSNTCFSCVWLNIQSERNKLGDNSDILIERNLNFMILAEFWIESSDADYYVQIGNLDIFGDKIVSPLFIWQCWSTYSLIMTQGQFQLKCLKFILSNMLQILQLTIRIWMNDRWYIKVLDIFFWRDMSKRSNS